MRTRPVNGTADEDVVILTRDQARRIVDVEAKARMGISGEEFLQRRARKALPDTLDAHDIAIVARLLDTNGSVER